jgi:hypothetical protein
MPNTYVPSTLFIQKNTVMQENVLYSHIVWKSQKGPQDMPTLHNIIPNQMILDKKTTLSCSRLYPWHLPHSIWLTKVLSKYWLHEWNSLPWLSSYFITSPFILHSERREIFIRTSSEREHVLLSVALGSQFHQQRDIMTFSSYDLIPLPSGENNNCFK